MPTKEEYYDKGLTLYGEQKYAEAIDEYNKALELDPKDGEIHLAVSISYQHLGKLDESIDAGRKAVEFCPQDALVYTNLSRVYQKKDMFQEAEEAMGIARRISMGF